jgi:hypothetical protein
MAAVLPAKWLAAYPGQNGLALALLELMLAFSMSDKSIAPYRQCFGCGEVLLPGCR